MENILKIAEINDYTIIQQSVIDIRDSLLKALSYIYMNRVSYDTVIDGNKKRVTSHRVNAAPLFLNTLDVASNVLNKKFTSAVDNKSYTVYDYCLNASTRKNLYSEDYFKLLNYFNVLCVSAKHYLNLIYSISASDLKRNNTPLTEDNIYICEDKVKNLINIIKQKTQSTWNMFAVLYTSTIENGELYKVENAALVLDKTSKWVSNVYNKMLEIVTSNDFIVNEDEAS